MSDARIGDLTIARQVIDGGPRLGVTPAGQLAMHKDLEVVSTT